MADPQNSRYPASHRQRTPPFRTGFSVCGVPWWTFFELQTFVELRGHTRRSAQRRIGTPAGHHGACLAGISVSVFVKS